MKKFLLLIGVLNMLCAEAQVNIPDANFLVKLKSQYPDCFTGNILDTICAQGHAETILDMQNLSISSLEGVRYFKNIRYLICENNQISAFTEYPDSLRYLYLAHNQLTSLPLLPDSLFYLSVESNQLTSFSALPAGLRYLICSDNQLTTLPSLPDPLISLYCAKNNLLTLPSLPNALVDLACGYNHLTTLPSLPNTLFYLHCSNNQLTSIPALPPILKYLYCEENAISSIPVLPNTLQYLHCTSNQIVVLPALSTTLKELHCSTNQLTTLPALPSTLTSLSCAVNQLSALPVLPDHLNALDIHTNNILSLSDFPSFLTYINIGNNPISVVPDFPDTLKIFYSYFNPISVLPALPNGMTLLYCINSSISSLPQLPDSLQELVCTDNHLSCLPYLPAGLTQIYFGGNSIDCFPNKPVGIATSYRDFPVCTPAVNTNSCPTFPVVSGTVYYDINSNNIHDPGEAYAGNSKVSIPGSLFSTLTNSNGFYNLGMDTIGTFSVEAATFKYYNLVPPSQSIVSTYFGQQISKDFALQPSIMNTQDLAVVLTPVNRARPGFNMSFKIDYHNAGTMTTLAQLFFEFPLLYTIDSTSEPAVVSSGKLSWDLGNLSAGESGSYYVYGKLLSSIPLGDSIAFESSVNKNAPGDDAYYEDNISMKKMQVVGSYDPNDITATPILSPFEVSQGHYIYYTIRFQNTGTDTAFSIVVADTLENKLDISTLEVISTSHVCNTFVKASDNTILFRFNDIKLVDRMHNEPASNGYVVFKVKPINTVQLDDMIENHASIFFDYNSPVITNIAQTLIGITLSTSIKEGQVEHILFYPNPAGAQIRFSENGIAELYSSEGVLVLRKEIRENVLEVASLKKGFYYLKYTGENGQSHFDKLIKD